MPDYRIRIRNSNLQFIGEVIDYMEFEYSVKMNDRGKWILTLPYNSEAAALLRGLFVAGNEGVGGIYVERDGKYVFSGPVLDREENWTEDGAHTMTFIGADEMDFIYRSLAMAHPKYFKSPFMKDGNGSHTDQTPNSRKSDPSSASMSSSEALYWIIRDNIGESAAVDGTGNKPRQIPQLKTKFNQGTNNDVGSERYPAGDLSTFPNPNPVVTRGDNMLDVLQHIAAYSESTVYNDDGSVKKPSQPFFLTVKMLYDINLGTTYGGWWIVAESRGVTDKTGYIIFSPNLRTVSSYRKVIEAPEANIIQIGGSGEGPDRVFAHSGDERTRPIYGDREGFREFTGYAPDTADPNRTEEREALIPHLYEELDRAGEKRAYEATIAPNDHFEYHKDWFVGDKVTFENVAGEKDQLTVREVNVRVSEDGEEIDAQFSYTSHLVKRTRSQRKQRDFIKWWRNIFKRTGGK
jgi:hypothetical protein